MPRTQSPSPRPSSQRWLSAALVAIGLVFVVAGLVMFAGGEPSEPRDYRTVSRSLIVGAALAAYGVWRMVGAKDAGTSTSGAPEPPVSPVPPAAQAAPSAAADLTGMLLHSDDVVATLRDLVSNGSRGPFGIAPELLSRTGLLEWQDAPKDLRASRLTRNGRWWLRMAPDVEGRGYDLLVGAEAALNISDDVAHGLGADAREVLGRVTAVAPRPHDGPYAAERIVEGSREHGEWQLRVRLADYLENCPLPFRVNFDLRANAEIGIACVDVECPRPESFALVGQGRTTPAGEARAYALRLALVVARGAIEVAGAQRAAVNCREHGSEQAVLSIDVTAPSLARLLDVAGRASLASSALPSDPALHASQSEDGWLRPVEPFVRTDGDLVSPVERFHEVELDDSPADDALRRSCGARRMSDLGINEKAPRVHAWNSLVGELGDTTHAAVSKLVDLRDATSDVTVAEACDRTSKALVDGALDVSNKHELAVLFVDGSSLSRAVRHARQALDADKPTAESLSSALEELERSLSPITEMGIYLDDADTVYRYFNSVAERVVYNRTVDDGRRAVDLVPDEYYSAHATASRILNMLGRSEEAIAHVQETVRVAPVTTDAKLGMVRCLEEQSRIFEAADLLKDAISRAATVRDMSICFYRLAYMEWKLGRADLAVACYQRSIALHPEISQHARAELQDLIASEEGLSELPDDEVLPALEAAGIPVGPVGEVRSVMLAAAAACTDAGAFDVARPLAGALAEIDHDDVIIDVRRSLTRP